MYKRQDEQGKTSVFLLNSKDMPVTRRVLRQTEPAARLQRSESLPVLPRRPGPPSPVQGKALALAELACIPRPKILDQLLNPPPVPDECGPRLATEEEMRRIANRTKLRPVNAGGDASGESLMKRSESVPCRLEHQESTRSLSPNRYTRRSTVCTESLSKPKSVADLLPRRPRITPCDSKEEGRQQMFDQLFSRYDAVRNAEEARQRAHRRAYNKAKMEALVSTLERSRQADRTDSMSSVRKTSSDLALLRKLFMQPQSITV